MRVLSITRNGVVAAENKANEESTSMPENEVGGKGFFYVSLKISFASRGIAASVGLR